MDTVVFVMQTSSKPANLLVLMLLVGFLCFCNTVFAEQPQESFQSVGKLPCSDLEYHSDRQFFRGSGIGTHTNARLAERIARLEANAQLSANISISVQSVTSMYLSQFCDENNAVYHEAMEHLTRQTTQRHLRNVQVVCSETDFEDGQYIVYLAVEVAADDVFSGLEKEFAADASLKHLYDKDGLRQILDEAMEETDAVKEREGQ